MLMSAGSCFGVPLETTTPMTTATTATAATDPVTMPMSRLRRARSCCFFSAATFSARRASRCCLTVRSFWACLAVGGTGRPLSSPEGVVSSRRATEGPSLLGECAARIPARPGRTLPARVAPAP
ncbi:hypothetical protein BC477_16915 [Clavibacter michiganensis subsp. michiganensis]|uniref:Uncharacterized protein n=1 Tax=Clavibacter michiganensis subsp. michiganensis TaxID=33013 RepID=A0A251XEE7_CLAMM|nr:hypothetical protein BC477_16915 [Clavibacter michiganensis subsp. michiganensis]OUE00410.1 hypothetical protein CMMCAS07_18585 [Clavibacter michiganensis subsp. michiganensis]